MKDNELLPQEAYWRSFGHGPRTVLAIHCTLAHSGAWRGLAGQLDSDATITAFDMLSHGRSPDWDRVGDYQDRNTAIARQFLTGRMDLIGHSFGATVALRLAVACPEQVRSLTLIEPVFFAVARQDAPHLVTSHNQAATPFWEAMTHGDDALGARLFNRMWSDEGPKWPDLPESTRAAMTRSIHVVPACNAALFDDRAGLLAPGVLDGVTAPTLLLRGSTSHPIIGAVNEGLAQRLPDATSRVIEGAGHMLPITHPAQTADALSAFWADHPAPRADTART